MKKKVAIVGLYTLPNMGDALLCETCEYLLKKNFPNIEVKRVDVCPRWEKDYRGVEYIKYRIARKMLSWSTKFSYKNSSRFRYEYEKAMWTLRLKQRYKREFRDVDAIIIAGGGFVKFRTQGLNYFDELIIEEAEKKNIPIMFNAIGVEGYDANDIRCQKLKKALNKSVVKLITTRDDEETLVEKYIYNDDIVVKRVGDPAFWANDCFGIQREKNSEIVGINVIRSNIFKDYGNKTECNQLEQFYIDLIKMLEKNKIKWKLFSNGMRRDTKFGENLLLKLGFEKDEKLLEAPTDAESLVKSISQFGCVFGARLHACITAYSLDIPVVGFIWNEKTEMFSRIIGKPENFFGEKDLSAEKIVKRIMEAKEEQYDNTIKVELKQLTEKYIVKFVNDISNC